MTPKRVLNWSSWVIVICLLVPFYLRFALDEPLDYARGGLGAVDFGVYYVAARMFVEHEDVYNYDLQTQQYLHMGVPRNEGAYSYPSPLALALTPLASLSFDHAARIWNLFNLLLLALSILIISRGLKLVQVLGDFYPLFIILFALAQPTIWSFRAGQSNILILFLLSLSLEALIRNDERLAGAAIGIASMIKIFPIGLLLLFIWQKRWRGLWSGLVSAGVLLGASQVFLFLIGSDSSTDVRFFTRILPFMTRSNPYPFNECVNGLISALNLPPPYGSILIATLSLVILAATMRAIGLDRLKDDPLSFATILIAFLLIASVTEVSTLLLLVIPFGVLLVVSGERARRTFLAIPLVISYVAINSILVLSATGTLEIPLVSFVPLAGTLMLWLLAIGKARLAMAFKTVSLRSSPA